MIFQIIFCKQAALAPDIYNFENRALSDELQYRVVEIYQIRVPLVPACTAFCGDFMLHSKQKFLVRLIDYLKGELQAVRRIISHEYESLRVMQSTSHAPL